MRAYSSVNAFLGQVMFSELGVTVLLLCARLVISERASGKIIQAMT